MSGVVTDGVSLGKGSAGVIGTDNGIALSGSGVSDDTVAIDADGASAVSAADVRGDNNLLREYSDVILYRERRAGSRFK